MLAEHFYKISAGIETAQVGDLRDLFGTVEQHVFGILKTRCGKIGRKTYPEFTGKLLGKIGRIDADEF